MQRCKFHVMWPKIFLLGNLNVKSIVHEDTLKIFTTRHKRTMWYLGTHSSGWICVHQKYQGNIWTKVGSHYSLQSSHITHEATGLLSSALHNYNLGTQDEKNKLLLCGSLWSKIFFQRWCKSPPKFFKKALCNINRSGGTQLPRIYNRL